MPGDVADVHMGVQHFGADDHRTGSTLKTTSVARAASRRSSTRVGAVRPPRHGAAPGEAAAAAGRPARRRPPVPCRRHGCAGRRQADRATRRTRDWWSSRSVTTCLPGRQSAPRRCVRQPAATDAEEETSPGSPESRGVFRPVPPAPLPGVAASRRRRRCSPRPAPCRSDSSLCASMSAARVTVSSTASGTCCARANLVQEIAKVAEQVRAAPAGPLAGGCHRCAAHPCHATGKTDPYVQLGIRVSFGCRVTPSLRLQG